jgi:hypothetical protein
MSCGYAAYHHVSLDQQCFPACCLLCCCQALVLGIPGQLDHKSWSIYYSQSFVKRFSIKIDYSNDLKCVIIVSGGCEHPQTVAPTQDSLQLHVLC